VTDAGGLPGPCPAWAPGAHLRREDGRPIVRDAHGAAVLVLNDTAAALWELCDGSTSMEEMVMAICDLSSISPTRARADVEATLARFQQGGVLASTARSSTPADGTTR
jgi:Coenzyme PQQ synthesis protein D (PqqD)